MPRHGVQYIANDEPSFIKNFKAKVGYKEGPGVDTKRQIPNFSDDEEDEPAIEKEDESPVVVVVKSGDLSAEEAKSVQKDIDEGPARLDEKITFKKPVKHKPKETEGSDSKQEEEEPKPKKKKKKDKEADSKKRKQTSLLSFGDEEEEN